MGAGAGAGVGVGAEAGAGRRGGKLGGEGRAEEIRAGCGHQWRGWHGGIGGAGVGGDSRLSKWGGGWYGQQPCRWDDVKGELVRRRGTVYTFVCGVYDMQGPGANGPGNRCIHQTH